MLFLPDDLILTSSRILKIKQTAWKIPQNGKSYRKILMNLSM